MKRSTATNRLNLFNNHNSVEEVLQNMVRNIWTVDKVLDLTHKEDLKQLNKSVLKAVRELPGTV